MKNIFFLFLLVTQYGFSQNKALLNLSHLTNKSWKTEGKWKNGNSFIQNIKFEYSLDSTLLKSKTYGFIDSTETEFGLRNEGIRQFDKSSKSIRFWEFDIFGGCTTGEFIIEDKSFYYVYNYEGMLLTDYWQFIDENTYILTVGTYEEGKWKQKFIETTFLGK
ncbi:MAG: hypothetical protein ACPGSD_06010 [Flavobacteriales bacterium]